MTITRMLTTSPSSSTKYDGCTEIFVGGGWAGVYSFYRRVMMMTDNKDEDAADDSDDASNKCLFEASWRIGGRTYSVPINRTIITPEKDDDDDDNSNDKNNTVHFVQDVGAYRFSPSMHMVGDLILHQLKLDTECYQEDCPPAQEDFPDPFMFNYTEPLRRIVSPKTKLPIGYATALTTMIEQAKSKGARVFTQHKLVGFDMYDTSSTAGGGDDDDNDVDNAENEVIRLTFQDTQTGVNITLPSNDDDENKIDVLMLNLPRNHLLDVEGLTDTLHPMTLKTLQCIAFDTPAELFGEEMATEMQKRKAYTTTLEKAYLYYEQDAWWRTKLNQIEGTWPVDVGFFAVETPEGVRLNIRWHDGPVVCTEDGEDDGKHCQGLLETYYSVSNETFYSSLSHSPDEPLGVIWNTDGPEAEAMLQQAHDALMDSLSPLIKNMTTSSSSSHTKLKELFPPPTALIVGVWRRPTKEHPYGQGYTAPTKVYYSPYQSGTPDVACQVPGLTETSYRDIVLQPWRNMGDGDNVISSGIRDRIFLANNDYSCIDVKYFWGDWAEETLLQAERAMLLLGTPPPSWTQNHEYYTREIMDKVSSEQQMTSSQIDAFWKANEEAAITTMLLPIVLVAAAVVLVWRFCKGKKAQEQAQYTPLP